MPSITGERLCTDLHISWLDSVSVFPFLQELFWNCVFLIFHWYFVQWDWTVKSVYRTFKPNYDKKSTKTLHKIGPHLIQKVSIFPLKSMWPQVLSEKFSFASTASPSKGAGGLQHNFQLRKNYLKENRTKNHLPLIKKRPNRVLME